MHSNSGALSTTVLWITLTTKVVGVAQEPMHRRMLTIDQEF
jgi:hypothetical protein